ncbi:hypothetical protein BDW62DRAFT_103220 [Aspergillus aurantiobrunneus]
MDERSLDQGPRGKRTVDRDVIVSPHRVFLGGSPHTRRLAVQHPTHCSEFDQPELYSRQFQTQSCRYAGQVSAPALVQLRLFVGLFSFFLPTPVAQCFLLSMCACFSRPSQSAVLPSLIRASSLIANQPHPSACVHFDSSHYAGLSATYCCKMV